MSYKHDIQWFIGIGVRYHKKFGYVWLGERLPTSHAQIMPAQDIQPHAQQFCPSKLKRVMRFGGGLKFKIGVSENYKRI